MCTQLLDAKILEPANYGKGKEGDCSAKSRHEQNYD